MRIGANVYDYKDAEDWAGKHIERGYGATYFPFTRNDDPDQIDTYAAAAKRHNLVIAEVGVWNNPLAKDPTDRERNIQYAIGQLKLADRIGARCCVNVSGSRNENWIASHKDNITQETFDEIVRVTRRIIDTANPQNTYYTLEPMPWSYPDSAESLHRLIEAIDRPAFAVHVDLCNLINSYALVYDHKALIRAFLRDFKEKIRVIHAKDTLIGEAMTLHISEAMPGEGLFDYDTFMEECRNLPADVPVMSEHFNSDADYKKATDFLKKKARKFGIEPVTGK